MLYSSLVSIFLCPAELRTLPGISLPGRRLRFSRALGLRSEFVNNHTDQAGGRAIGRAPQRVPDLGRQNGMLQKQRHQDRSVGGKRVQRRVLLGGVEKHLAWSAIREIANLQPV